MIPNVMLWGLQGTGGSHFIRIWRKIWISTSLEVPFLLISWTKSGLSGRHRKTAVGMCVDKVQCKLISRKGAHRLCSLELYKVFQSKHGSFTVQKTYWLRRLRLKFLLPPHRHDNDAGQSMTTLFCLEKICKKNAENRDYHTGHQTAKSRCEFFWCLDHGKCHRFLASETPRHCKLFLKALRRVSERKLQITHKWQSQICESSQTHSHFFFKKWAPGWMCHDVRLLHLRAIWRADAWVSAEKAETIKPLKLSTFATK